MTPSEFLNALNSEGSDFADSVTSLPGYKKDMSEFLPLDSSDFFMDIEDKLYWFSLDAMGSCFEMTRIDSNPVYYWEESMIGDTAGFSVDEFEAELNNLVPGLFVRQNGCSPTANQNQFVDLFRDDIQRIWDEALENA